MAPPKGGAFDLSAPEIQSVESPKRVTGVMAHGGNSVDVKLAQPYIQAQGVV
jgi:hypothetical protein